MKLKMFIILTAFIVAAVILSLYLDNHVNSSKKDGPSYTELMEKQGIRFGDQILLHDSLTKINYDSLMNTPEFIKMRKRQDSLDVVILKYKSVIAEVVISSYKNLNFNDIKKDTVIYFNGDKIDISLKLVPELYVNGKKYDINLKWN